MPIYNYAIALGWNMPEGSLTNLEAISVSGAVLSLEDIINQYAVNDNTHYLAAGREFSERNMVMLGDATVVQNGRENKPLTFLAVSDKALNYWITTYEGKKVTIKTTLRQYNSYTRYNATIGAVESQAAEYLHGTWWYNEVRIPVYIKGTAT